MTPARPRRAVWLLFLALALSACSSRPPAPVIDRSTVPQKTEIPADGLYRVRGGDTLHGIAFKYGLDFRKIADWNSIRSPYTIYPDQILKLRQPPPASKAVTIAAAPTPRANTRSSPEAAKPKPVPPATSSPGSETRAAPANTPADPPAKTTSKPPLKTSAADPVAWLWPTNGRLLRTYKAGDPSRNGLDITGKEGQNIVATASGEVVYSGNGLIGYGELIIVKHNERMLSAYAHNRQRLVNEGDAVRQGQKIAEMGRNDRNETILHFEIRRDGEPVDPRTYLPKQ